jgi:hypothetical protein
LTGLYKILVNAFGSVQKKMSGKPYAQNVHVLRIVVEVILTKHRKDEETPDHLDNFLQPMSSQSLISPNLSLCC